MYDQTWLAWEAAGRPVPPPHIVKQWTVKHYGEGFSLRTFIETGTYLGEMVQAVKASFKTVLSIELEPLLYERAKTLFAQDDHVTIHYGDSGVILADLLASIKHPCLFWLDGHWTGGPVHAARGQQDTPILQELGHILGHRVKNHVILIDDARLFNGTNDYPSLEQLRETVSRHDSALGFHVENDIIRIHR